MAERRGIPAFQESRALRQSHFNRVVRQNSQKEALARRDEERRRMEEYRRLCKAEGITSKRLQEYDAAREAHSREIDESLRQVDDNMQMSNTEKKRKKHKILEKAAATQLSSNLSPRSSSNPFERAKHKMEEQQAKVEQSKCDAAARAAQREQRVAERNKRNGMLKKRTRSGQPVMSAQMACLLDKISTKLQSG